MPAHENITNQGIFVRLPPRASARSVAQPLCIVQPGCARCTTPGTPAVPVDGATAELSPGGASGRERSAEAPGVQQGPGGNPAFTFERIFMALSTPL